MSPVFFEEIPISTRYEVDDILRVLTKCRNGVTRSFRWDCMCRYLDDRSECTVIVKEKKSLVSLLVGISELSGIQRWSVMSSMLSANILQELFEDSGRPCVRGVREDALKQVGVPFSLLFLAHGQTLVDGLSNAQEVMRVDL